MLGKIKDAEVDLKKAQNQQRKTQEDIKNKVKAEDKIMKIEENLRRIYKKEKEKHTVKGKKKLDHLRRKFGTTAVNKNEEEVKREYPGLDCYIEDEDPPTEANVEEDILIVELVEEKGMLKLSKPEIAILNMGPDFQLLDAINEEDTEVELAAMGTKIRWQTQREIGTR